MNANVIRTGGVRVFISGEFRKNLATLSRLFAANANHRFESQKRSQLFIRVHNEGEEVPAKRARFPKLAFIGNSSLYWSCSRIGSFFKGALIAQAASCRSDKRQ